MTGRQLRVGVVADMLEEGWPSMDLVAEMLMTHLAGPVRPVLLRPALRRRLGLLAFDGRGATVDRIVNRFFDYPRWLRGRHAAADVFHVVDHSYAHLVHSLPAGRVVVTCHDTDAFRAVLDGGRESKLPRALVRRIARGLGGAAMVACVSETTRRELVAAGLVPLERTEVVLNGVHQSCTPDPDAEGDAEAERLLGPSTGPEVLHVGSTIPRKRVDVLLEVFAGIATAFPDARLVRVGGPFSPAQNGLATRMDVLGRIIVLPGLSRRTLAAVYRRAALVLLPSAREGFGLPLVEALACGTPVLASDIPVLREVGGTAATYAPVGDVERWHSAAVALLHERRAQPDTWRARQRAGLDRASAFSWAAGARRLTEIYRTVAGHAGA